VGGARRTAYAGGGPAHRPISRGRRWCISRGEEMPVESAEGGEEPSLETAEDEDAET